MRKWIFALFTLTWFGCEGSNSPDASPLHKLCLDACAHVHAENCFEAPAVDVGKCESECANVQSFAGGPCTDEQAALYECTATSEIVCSSASGQLPRPKDCAAEEQAIASCDSPGLTCTRSIGSDEVCFQFGFSQFFVCSEGISPDTNCLQVSNTGFCCP